MSPAKSESWRWRSRTVERITQDVAGEIGKLALALQKRGHAPLDVAHFLMKCVFCLFAEDINLLPNKLFTRLLQRAHKDPDKFKSLGSQLFAAMKTGGEFGLDPIPFFNGGLFDDAEALDLNISDIGLLLIAAGQDWAAVEPHIFGTLFERALDPSKRAQIGAHYTGRDDIMLVVEPVVMAPLRREWDAAKAKIGEQVAKRAEVVKGVGVAKLSGKEKQQVNKINDGIHETLQGFQGRLSHVRVLDPACGSGNFLYIALQQLLNLEKEIIAFGARPEIAMPLIPRVRPTQLHGIEINTYAAELASVVIWIGYLQWMRDNGFVTPSNPVLERMKSIENRDAILDLSNPIAATIPEWPKADFIVGNPPFAGRGEKRQLLTKLFGDTYVDTLNRTYDAPLQQGSDLCCYWFERARRYVEVWPTLRVGLLATQGIRGGTNRKVLHAIKESGDIFFAISDRDWLLDGAMVHVSIVGFDDGTQSVKTLDGNTVDDISADLKADDRSTALELEENKPIAHQGAIPSGRFDPPSDIALEMLVAGGNPSGKSNADVVIPWANGEDMLDSRDVSLIINFGSRSVDEAALFEKPFAWVKEHVLPARKKSETSGASDTFWQLWRSREKLRRLLLAMSDEGRFLATPRVSKHRIFVWVDRMTLPSDATVAFVRNDDFFFGTVQSSIHALWALDRGTQLREKESGNRYSHTFTFRTFPLPWPPGKEDLKHPTYLRIAEAAKTLNEQRERWLNPPEWIGPLAAKIDAADTFDDVPVDARALVRQSAIMAAAAKDSRLKKRTLTNLYNERPTWLKLAHEKLDRAVLAAYAATDAAGDEAGWSEDWAKVWVETGAGQPLPADHPLAAKRAEVDQKVLANLLRLNHARARGREEATAAKPEKPAKKTATAARQVE
ncbi:class I SAM-dependent DNA methyltransferase [Humisphaera borealis]|uniref:site-specific DNA-methyltransferase (adenine-specific) n=1 Tax=Humisphaera borealis TaxID=2807512 RepID=A0A7M2WWC5_9BACT|nr:class I SAM-dependent DNA methyltransferase [Humisphaera borealis]QOV89795.1 class I SAM-dependent DNA methyltransferase [Humisphaera borealis]